VFWRWRITLSGFLHFAQSSEFQALKNTTFRKLDLFPSSGEGRETPTLLGTLERANPNQLTIQVQVRVQVILRPTVSRPVRLGVGPALGPMTLFQFSLFDNYFLSSSCSAIIYWLESRRTHNHLLLSHVSLLKPGGLRLRIYVLQEQGGPDIPPGTGFPFCRFLGLAGLWWRYSNPLNTGQDLRHKFSPPFVSQFHVCACVITIFTAYFLIISFRHSLVSGAYSSCSMTWVFQWLRLALSKGPNSVGASFFSTEDGNITL
jgi:hypothetical protein